MNALAGIKRGMEFVSMTRGVEIGANSYLLRSKGRHVILDAGSHPKREGLTSAPDFGAFAEGSAQAVIVTHSHQDHVGALPILTRRERNARVFMTEATARISDVMLHNSVNVMMRQKEEHNIQSYPLFTHRGVELSREAWQPCKYRITYDFKGERASEDKDAVFEFYPAGHILGAAGVKIQLEGKTIFYTGDVNFENQTLIKGADFPESGVDVLIIETTRGDSPTPPGYTRAKEEERLAESISEAFDRGGSVTIPVFALGKTQELLAMLWRMRLSGQLASVPVYIGGLSTKLTTIYDSYCEDIQRQYPELQLLQEMAPYVLSGNDVVTMPARKKCIFALSSGMMTENTLSNIFARKILGDPKQSIFFVGYSDPDSPSGKLRAAKRGDPVALDSKLPGIPMECEVKEFNFSAHAGRESLLNYAIALKPKKIILVHGDRPAIDWFHLRLHRDLPDTDVIIPEPGVKIPL
ncbi:MAG: MBL fold metallo-hydrolase [Terrimicrobiaceae bacterium]